MSYKLKISLLLSVVCIIQVSAGIIDTSNSYRLKPEFPDPQSPVEETYDDFSEEYKNLDQLIEKSTRIFWEFKDDRKEGKPTEEEFIEMDDLLKNVAEIQAANHKIFKRVTQSEALSEFEKQSFWASQKNISLGCLKIRIDVTRIISNEKSEETEKPISQSKPQTNLQHEPIPEPIPEPILEPIPEPIPESIPEPIPEPILEPIHTPLPGPIIEEPKEMEQKGNIWRQTKTFEQMKHEYISKILEINQLGRKVTETSGEIEHPFSERNLQKLRDEMEQLDDFKFDLDIKIDERKAIPTGKLSVAEEEELKAMEADLTNGVEKDIEIVTKLLSEQSQETNTHKQDTSLTSFLP